MCHIEEVEERRKRVSPEEGEFFIDNLLVRIYRCFWCTGLAPSEFESPFPGSLISTFLCLLKQKAPHVVVQVLPPVDLAPTFIVSHGIIKEKGLQFPGTNFVDKTLEPPESTYKTTFLVWSKIWFMFSTRAWSPFPLIKAR